MAYTTAQLVAAYTNANLGKAPDAATTLTLDAYATQSQTGGISDTTALTNTLKLLNSTTAVAVETYQFFTGRAPSAAGLSFLVNSTTNTSDLNDAYYSKFSAENRFINFSINLATGQGEGAAAFAAAYGSVSVAQTVATAYDKIIGNATAAAAGVDVAAAVAFLSRADNITYLTNFVKANTGLTAAADIDLAVKAALIGEILNVATVSGLGAYAGATTALITDLSDGTLSTDSAAGVNILTAYPAAGATGTTYTLKAGPDTIVGTSANDTFNALNIDANGAAATTFSDFDSIDGGNGVDTLNVYTKAGSNGVTLPANLTVKNVEKVFLFNATATSGSNLADASIYQGVQQLWQVGAATETKGVANGVVAGFKDLTTGATVTTNSTATSAAIAFDNQKESQTFIVDGSANKALAGVTVTGTVADNDGDGVVNTNVTLKVGKDVAAVSLNSTAGVTLTVDDSASTTTKVSSVDLSASTGAITFVGDTDVRTITGGAGADTLTIATTTVKDNTATTVDETVTATLNSGAGADDITISTTGTGVTTVTTGAGDDTVNVTSRSDVLKVDLGDGSDTFTSGVAITAADTIDAGAGSDTLSLQLVGSANVIAFKNFDVFDVNGLDHNLDLDILATNNTVSEIVGSGTLGAAAATLSNLGAGVSFRATADMGTTDVLSLTQKTGGALTVTLDADQTGTDTAADDTAGVAVTATNATSVTAVFDTSYLNKAGAVTGETAATDNVSTIALTTAAATAVTVVSGGANAQNFITIADGATAANDKLATITVTGASHLDLTASALTKLATIDASASTGGLSTSLAGVASGGTIKLGSGADLITVTSASTTGDIESIQNFEKAIAAAVGTNAAAKAAAILDTDLLSFTGAVNADGAITGGTIAKGVLTFTGAGPATLTDAIGLADAGVTTAGNTVVFQYLTDTYVFVQGGATDTVVKLTGVTGVTNYVEDGTTNHFFVV
ncbi:S-layer protein [Caulobacter sp. RL271]|jgi:hypothetical protein|uniref:S-layer protein n=1 Tax=Caulobacter segnis TaxID=88688 RepID=A0ABY4ZXS0_9CAUL|nr:S-layer protein [Caulobacter segnis]USQ97429.1 S-layer protein [Caulobacter segnis]